MGSIISRRNTSTLLAGNGNANAILEETKAEKNHQREEQGALKVTNNPEVKKAKMPCCGPGYASPKDAIKGPREKVLFVTCPHVSEDHQDMIAAVDVDPESPNYCQVISRVVLPNTGDEVHHLGWNACSSCHDKPSAKRSHLIVPCLNSDRIYAINVEDPRHLKLDKTIYADQLKKFGVTFPHTAHCLADGNIMISTLGDEEGEGKGNFLLLDGNSFDPKGLWMEEGKSVAYGYDFWYQPRRNVMLSTEWGVPKLIKQGFNLEHVQQGKYGHHVHLFDWKTHELKESLELPMPQGSIPLEVRFHHEPTSTHAFVGTALGSSVFHIHPDTKSEGKWKADLVIEVKALEVEGWILPQMPSLITDILVSMNDKFLYFSNWLHGDLRQYDISDPAKPKLTGQVWLGGSLHSTTGIKVKGGQNFTPYDQLVVKGKKVDGSPQMLQLSLDGKRLYVTMSLYRKWDSQFYPDLLKNGSVMLQLDCHPNGGMALNKDFLIDFGGLDGGPYIGHEMRYPGGDCTSDIWI